MIKNIELANISVVYSATNTILNTILKNTCCGNNVLSGIGMDIALLQFPITSITLSFKSFCLNRTILAINSMKKYILTCETASYIKTKLKPSRKYSKLTVTIELKNALTQKVRLGVWGYTNGEYPYMLDDEGLTLKYKIYTIKLLDDALEA